jgi:hypothetical protein
MNKSTLKAISESTNQMIVNSVTSTKAVATQNVAVNQKINIKVKDVAGDVTISNIKNVSTIDLNNIANISFSAFDNIRTDLANSVLQSFKSNTNNESMGQMELDLQTSIANQNDAAVTAQNETKVDQKKTTNLPSNDPMKIIPSNDNANISIKQKTSNDLLDITETNQNYQNEISMDKTIQTNINNAVTQNFTKESLSQLAQIINSNQDISIDVEGVGGNVSINDISNTSNIILRQTMTSSVNVGNAIVNSVVNSMGIITDDAVTTKNIADTGVTNKTDLRNGNTSTATLTNKLDYKQTISQDFGFGSCGSSMSSCICCICCIVCILSCGLGGMTAMIPSGSEESSSEEKSEEEKSEESSEEEKSEKPSSEEKSPSEEEKPSSEEIAQEDPKGGYYYFY